MTDGSEGKGDQDRRSGDRRSGERRQQDVPLGAPERRSGKEQRIGSRRTGTELKFCSSCGKKITGLPTIPVSIDNAVTIRLCPECARSAAS